MTTETKIREAITSLKNQTKQVKESVDKSFYAGLDPSKPGFFEVVTLMLDGREVKVIKGLLIAGLRAAKTYRGEVIRAAGAGKRFAEGIGK